VNVRESIKDREKIRKRKKAQRAANRAKYLEYEKRYRAANPEVGKEKAHRRRAKAKGVHRITMTAAQHKELSAIATRCYYCKKPFTKTRKKTLDHVLAIATKGDHAETNVVMACIMCNSSKGASNFDPVTGQGLLL
jgi:5-methylcytosine-specific restriction endonuclease McrA